LNFMMYMEAHHEYPWKEQTKEALKGIGIESLKVRNYIYALI